MRFKIFQESDLKEDLNGNNKRTGSEDKSEEE